LNNIRCRLHRTGVFCTFKAPDRSPSEGTEDRRTSTKGRRTSATSETTGSTSRMGKPAAHGRESLKLISLERPMLLLDMRAWRSRLNYPKQKRRLLRKPATAGLFRRGSRHPDMAVTGERR
jgi:hypothetical protein